MSQQFSAGNEQRPIPALIVSMLQPEERVVAVFEMRGGLDIYATERRFIGKRGERLIDIAYSEVSTVRRRRSRGLLRGGVGGLFLVAGLLTGFQTPAAATIAVLLCVFGLVLLGLGLFMREHWVELRVEREDPRPSFGHVVMFFPFWLFLRHGRRYTASGTPAQVEALFRFLDRMLREAPPGGR